MSKVSLILFFLLFGLKLDAQVMFKAIATRQEVAVGESFQVQYILDDLEKDNQFMPPVFKNFRVVSGPNTYTGSINDQNGSARLKNVVFTLVPLKPGRFVIPGATATVNGRKIKSDVVIIEVLTKKEAKERAAQRSKREDPSEYFLRPGEDPHEKMKKNLFMKVLVDRTSCYVGQPVVATFKLYSRLESRSDIVKNPGFYGFTVQDIVSLNHNISRTEMIGGKAYAVHTIRVVQLYPLREGIFNIDPMEVSNKVEFSSSVVNKKPEQEIIEGVVEDDRPVKSNTITYENHISTKKIEVRVKPHPSVKKPATFSGATGKFIVEANVEKNELSKNEQGAFIVRIKGKGNFTQLTAPVVQWPNGIEGFDPVITDSLEKTHVPLKGSRTFRFPFVSDRPGDYTIPAISFSFFDPDSNNYGNVSSAPAVMKISNFEKKAGLRQQATAAKPEGRDHKTILLYACIFIIVLVIISLQLRQPKETVQIDPSEPEHQEAIVSPGELLKPVQFSLIADDGNFYMLLQKSIWEYLGTQLGLAGMKMNKYELHKVMREKNMEDQYRTILSVLEECEAAAFTKAEWMHDKQDLLNRARSVLVEIKA